MNNPQAQIAAAVQEAHHQFRSLQKLQKAPLTEQPLKINCCDELSCPHCGADNLHHGVVDIYGYGDVSPALSSRGANVQISGTWPGPDPEHPPTSKPSNGQSSPQAGIMIALWCENCPALSELRIKQDKGHTMMTICIVGARTK